MNKKSTLWLNIYDDSCDLSVLKDLTIAVLGYGQSGTCTAQI
jgi:ketol-acid reductoisomerase (EC 1.1.1.86)